MQIRPQGTPLGTAQLNVLQSRPQPQSRDAKPADGDAGSSLPSLADFGGRIPRRGSIIDILA